ncbi:hypothetical protein BGZ79_009594 [Entomortierella chlamydospora]|nr:hypothetical protein BGZ79_009594 [Entomortierella chlamydospora]
MNGPTSPFEIPLNVDLISQDLSKKDIANCNLVNSDFHTQFKRHLWHEFKVSVDKQQYRNKGFSPVYQNAILENGHLIHKLSIHGEIFGNVFEFIVSSPCENLFEIMYIGRRPKEFDPIIGLINRNTFLRLCLGDSDNRATPLEYETLLKCLPKNLQYLKLDWDVAWEANVYEEDDHDNGDYGRYPESEKDEKNEDEDKDTGNDDAKPPSNNTKWPEKYFHLRSVDMSMRLSESENSALFPFLQRCPALEEVKIVGAPYSIFKTVVGLLSDTRLFPALTKVSVGKFVIDPSSGLLLISGMKGRISALMAEYMTILSSSLFIGALTTQWAETLEMLRFNGDVTVSNDDIELVLTTCPNLKTFSIENKPNGSYLMANLMAHI